MRQYLLGQLTEADEENVELRLLTDADYSEELDIIVDELIDQYVEKEGLPAEERELLEQHFFKSPERLGKLKFALALKKQKPRRIFNKYRTKNLLTFYLPIAASILIIIGLGIGVWRAFLYQSDAEKGLVALQTAYRDQRPVEARVSGFNYAPTAKQRGGQELIDYVSRDRAAKLLLNAVSENPSADSYHALGKYYLAERQFDKAIDQFNAALSREPQNAQLHSDLGAALLEKGKSHSSEAEQDREVEEFARSLDHLNKALELNNSLLEALFNRALLYEQMMLPQQAEDDWQRYLERDPNSKWADEARQNLKRLEEKKKSTAENKKQSYLDFLNNYQAGDSAGAWQNIAQSSCRVGNCIVERLIDEYLSLAAKGLRVEAEDKHLMISYIGTATAQRTGDLYASALARFYKAVTPEQITQLTKARYLMRTGQGQIASAQFPSALKSHIEARQLFDKGGDQPESKLAEYWMAVCYQQLNEQEQSALLFRTLEQTCERDKYSWLAVRVLNALATQEAMLGDFSKAIKYSLRASEMAERILESYGEISALSFLIEAYLYLGNRQQSLSYVRRALTSAFNSPEPKQRWVAYNEVAWMLSSFGFDAAAADYQKVALQLALKLQEPSIVSLSFIRLGAMYGKVADYDKALETLQQGFKIAETYSHEPFAQQMIAYASLQIGHLYKQMGELDKAVASYNSCIDLYNRLNSPAFVYQARKGKLLSLIAANDIPAAKEELNVTLGLYEEYRSKIAEESNRNSFFDLEHDVFDIAIDFEYSTLGDHEKAFEYSELSRARSLLASTRTSAQPTSKNDGSDLNFPADSHRFDLATLRAELPEQVQILQYAVLENRVVIWVVSRQDFRSTAIEIGSEQLDEKIQDYLRFILNRDQAQTLRAGGDLYSLLIQPVEALLDRNKELFIVPDKYLNNVPFSALISPESGKYLIQNYLLVLVPSSNVFLACTYAAQKKGRASDEKLLSVGNPAFDRQEFADLPDLPSSGEEAQEIASFYNSSSLFTGKGATKGKIMAEMEKMDVIHLASHFIMDEVSPLRSKLLLASEPVQGSQPSAINGVLQASEIYEMKFLNAKLVVLSACQTGVGHSFRGEGVMSMARPFLAGGVPLVVASLWAVDSDATKELMVNFHRYRKREGVSTAEALRRAQLSMLSNPQSLYQQPYYWASFNVIGGHAEM